MVLAILATVNAFQSAQHPSDILGASVIVKLHSTATTTFIGEIIGWHEHRYLLDGVWHEDFWLNVHIPGEGTRKIPQSFVISYAWD